MCGIFGIIGESGDLAKRSIDALYDLEYRGYDSSGIAYIDSETGEIDVHKSTGKIDNLREYLAGKDIRTTTMIAHTRWATHGKISINNAHPHSTENVAIVHNGIITNYEQLRSKLDGFYNFYGECDSELIAKLIDYHLVKSTQSTSAFCTPKEIGDSAKKECVGLSKVLRAFSLAVKELRGSFAIACIIKNQPNLVLVARRESPIYLAKVGKTLYASSDLITFPPETRQYIELGDNEICVMRKYCIKVYNTQLKELSKREKKFEVSQNKVCLNGFSHFMIKEIFDIPKALHDTAKGLQNVHLGTDLGGFDEVHLIACGTAYHSACVGATMIRNIARIPAYAHIASDFIDDCTILDRRHLYVFISQSGETFDTILGLKKVKASGCTTLTITNTTYSTLANLSDCVIPIVAGKEVAVASTKVYNASNLACLFLASKIKARRERDLSCCGGNADEQAENARIVGEIEIDYNPIKELLASEFEKDFSKKIIKYKTIFFVGKCEDYITAMEASLKLKEITYINCSAFPAGELKHGTLALVDEETLVIAYLTNGKYAEKVISTLSEIKARGGKVLAISSQELPASLVDDCYKLPKCANSINALLYSIIPMQKVAYYTALELGLSPDKPRNLAKSVTVG